MSTMPLWSADPVVIVVSIVVVWVFWVACVRRDAVARRRAERETKR